MECFRVYNLLLIGALKKIVYVALLILCLKKGTNEYTRYIIINNHQHMSHGIGFSI